MWPSGRGVQTTRWPPNLGPPPASRMSEEKEKQFFRKNHTSLGRLVSAALAGSRSRRRTTLIGNPQVPGMLDSFDTWRPWVHRHVRASTNHAPPMGQLFPCLRERFLSQRLGEGHSKHLQIHDCYSRLSLLSSCGEILSLKSGITVCELMSTVSI